MSSKTKLISFENSRISIKDKIVFLDIDGTLIADSELSINEGVLNQIKKLKIDNVLYLCTNSLNKERNKKIETLLGLKLINHDQRKPSKKIVDKLGKTSNFVVIGDKILVDGLFAKKIGADFIKVKRKISGNESLIVKITNFVDDFVYALSSTF